MNPATLRERLGITRAQLAHALGIHERTVMRWETETSTPTGLAAEVLYGIARAIDSGADAAAIGKLIADQGISALLCHGLTDRPRRGRRARRGAKSVAAWPSFVPHPDDVTRCYVCGRPRGLHGTAPSRHCAPAIVGAGEVVAARVAFAGVKTPRRRRV